MKVYVTFGRYHLHRIAGETFDSDTVCEIEGNNLDECTMHVAAYFGDDYAVLYPAVPPDLTPYSRGIRTLPGSPVLGRPRELTQPKRQQILLEPADLETARSLGNGNVSAGIREALRQAQLEANP